MSGTTDRIRKSIGAENTFQADLREIDQARDAIKTIIAKVCRRVAHHHRLPEAVTSFGTH